MSTRDVLRKAKPKVHSVDISSGTVYVRALSGGGRDAYLDLVKESEPKGPPSHRVAALGLCEEDGTLSYDTADKKQMDELHQVDGEDLQKISMKLFEVSGLTEKSVDDAEKKSEASPS